MAPCETGGLHAAVRLAAKAQGRCQVVLWRSRLFLPVVRDLSGHHRRRLCLFHAGTGADGTAGTWLGVRDFCPQRGNLSRCSPGACTFGLYRIRGQGRKTKYSGNWMATNDRRFLFNDQTYDNVFWSMVGTLVWSLYEIGLWWGYANGVLPYSTNPVWFVLWMILMPFWRNFHFYWIHRLIHWPPLYRTRPLSAPQERQRRPLVRRCDAPGGTCDLF